MLVTIPFDRVIRIATEQADIVHTCPTQGHECLNDRQLKPYISEESECVNCWIQYLLNEN